MSLSYRPAHPSVIAMDFGKLYRFTIVNSFDLIPALRSFNFRLDKTGIKLFSIKLRLVIKDVFFRQKEAKNKANKDRNKEKRASNGRKTENIANDPKDAQSY